MSYSLKIQRQGNSIKRISSSSTRAKVPRHFIVDAESVEASQTVAV